MAQLTDILLGSNKRASSGWAASTGRSFDVLMDDYGPGNWSIACNKKRIVPGTIGWIVRSDGGWGHIAGILAITEDHEDVKEPHGTVTYARGIIFPLPREWWIDGARLHLDGWDTRAPFGLTNAGGRLARFRAGESLDDHLVALIEQHLHSVALDWVDRGRAGLLDT